MMIKKQDLLLKPLVVVIAGYVGSGKSTIAASLSRVLGDAPVLIFDHYEKFIEWPQDMSMWIREGANPDQIRIPKLKEDLLNLLHRVVVSDPMDGEALSPSQYILIEEPSGGLRAEIHSYIDWVVCIDVPQGLCVVRLVQRLLDLETWHSQNTFADASKDDLVHRLDAIAGWLTHYQQVRSMYMLVSHRVRQEADLVIDGTMTVEEVTARIVKGIQERNTRRLK
jgi:uridine kinase